MGLAAREVNPLNSFFPSSMMFYISVRVCVDDAGGSQACGCGWHWIESRVDGLKDAATPTFLRIYKYSLDIDS